MADDVLGTIADFGESVVYRPRCGAPRTVGAIVERLPAEMFADVGVSGPVIQITVANDPTTGISSAELDLGRDQVDVAVRVGGEAETRPIGAIVGPHDRGAITLEVR